jgi:RNA polymerase sigma-70 factor (ECF subfamily)
VNELARHEWVAAYILPHEARVRSWLRRQFQRLTPSDVDDLMQDAYLHLCDVEFARITNGRAYLIAILRNLLAEQARRARIVPMERLGEIDALRIPSEEPGPDRTAGAQQELEQLERSVAQLPKRCRCAFELRTFHSLSLREVADEMNVTVKAVQKHIAAALVRINDAKNEEAESRVARSESGIRGNEREQSGN